MLNPEDSVYLQHILTCIDRIEEYTLDFSKEKFLKSNLVQDAVIRQLEVIGEATNHLSKDVTGTYVHLDWKDMIGMRNKLIHDYLGVDIEQVWKTVVDDIPFLKKEIKTILAQ